MDEVVAQAIVRRFGVYIPATFKAVKIPKDVEAAGGKNAIDEGCGSEESCGASTAHSKHLVIAGTSSF